MRRGSLSLVWIAAACAACGSSPSEPGTGGAGGATGSTSTSTSTSSTTTTTTTTTASTTTSATGGTGGTGTGTCTVSGENVYANSAVSGFPACDNAIVPASNEDGSFTVAVFGPFPKAFSLKGFSFLSWEQANAGVSDPWTATAVVVPAGADPLEIDPDDSAKPYSLTTLESTPDGGDTYHRFSIQLDAPLSVGACEKVLIALRNTVGPPRSAIVMCGDAASQHPETNQWWNADGTMDQMSSYGPNFDRDWDVTLTPATP